MSSSPTPIRQTPEQQRERQEKHSRRADVLYVVGSLLLVAGVSTMRISWGLMTAGGCCMLLPVLELVGSFIRGLRLQSRGR